jgi:ATP-dependent exoDNAse (exonuclease V) alpha subunit
MSVEPDSYQQAAIDAVLDRRDKDIFTGPAGTGKSFTLRHLVAEARERGRRLAVCSSTGRSAVELQLRATTLHGFLALGDTGTRSASAYIRQLRSPSMAAHREQLMQLDMLVVDEVSMLDAEFLGKAEAIVAGIRVRDEEPWGGVQVVFSGDFAQLQPVPNRKRNRQGRVEMPRLAFHASRAWIDARVHTYSLTELHRQSEDASYGSLLNRARFALQTPDDVARLSARRITPREAGTLASRAVFLFSRNRDVDEYNSRRMQTLETAREHTYAAQTDITKRAQSTATTRAITQAATKAMRESMRAPASLSMRVGARVMLLANVDVSRDLANGCTGVIVDFDDDDTHFPIVKFDSRPGRVLVRPYEWKFEGDVDYTATYKQVPLMLAWAVSIHRSQGLTLDCVVADLSPSACFSAGMAYVVLSRVRSLDSLHLLAFSSASLYTDRDVTRFYHASA